MSHTTPHSADDLPRVLVVDDHASAREAMTDVLRHAGCRAESCASASEALRWLEQASVDVVVTDLQMPGMNGVDFIREIQRLKLPLQVLMVTAHASVPTAVEAMRLGAFDYVEKPIDAPRLEESVLQAFKRGQLMQPDGETFGAAAGTGMTRQGTIPQIIGNSPAIEELRSRIAQIAPTDETVLVCGESGTGKELVAQALHALSPRHHGPLVSLNCPVLSSQLTESELFGHRRGAFTGAETDRLGRFQMADGGSILLDEITEINLELQAKLLRVLQERSFEPVGSSDTVTVDVRVLATTNRNLQEETKSRQFREDLYYRLAVLPIHVPPLRDRGDDVVLLADHFLHTAARRLNREPCILEPPARELLGEYHWPGNVRELQNIVTRACVLYQNEPIRADVIRPWLRMDESTAPPGDTVDRSRWPVGLTLDEVERQMIIATLEKFDGHRQKTAAALGIGVRTLSGKLRAYGFSPRAKKLVA